MYARTIKWPKEASFFVFGPRGTGKSTWIRKTFPQALYIDLLDDRHYSELLAHPTRLQSLAEASGSDRIIIDEIQKLPILLDEVHRLIEARGFRFVLTGSSARKLRRAGANLLGGRARTLSMHPLSATELGGDFNLAFALRNGHLPAVVGLEDPEAFLRGYVGTYLREEVRQEALVRNIASFARFLEAASFSQAALLSVQSVATDCGIPRKTAEAHFELLDDLLLAVRLPVFRRRAKRKLVAHPKFYYFDAGVFRALRPQGPFDFGEEVEGAALETLVLQELRAQNANLDLGYEITFWRTSDGKEVDFVLYGPRGLIAIEVKRSHVLRDQDLSSLRLFLEDHPGAEGLFLYGGERSYQFENVRVLPVGQALLTLPSLLHAEAGDAGH